MNKILKNELYETPVFEDIREVIAYPVKNYPENIAFKIKEKEGKKVSYKEITYKESNKCTRNSFYKFRIKR